MTEKLCVRCQRVLPVSEFRPNPKMRCGLTSWCKGCQREATRRSRAKHRDRYNAARRKWPKGRPIVGGVETRVTWETR